jgi:hypothetical protein
MRGVGEHDEPPHRRNLLADRLQDRQEGQVRQHQRIFGVVDDPGDLVAEEPRIDSVVDEARTGDAVPSLQMPPGVPCQRRHALAGREALHGQALGEPQRAGADRSVVRAVQRPLDGPADDGAGRVIARRVVDDGVDSKRPVLHQALHDVSPVVFCITLPASGDCARGS